MYTIINKENLTAKKLYLFDWIFTLLQLNKNNKTLKKGLKLRLYYYGLDTYTQMCLEIKEEK